MKKKPIRERIESFLSILYEIENKNNISDMAKNIIEISSYINKKYPDIDVITKLIDNLLKYIHFGYTSGFEYIDLLYSNLTHVVSFADGDNYDQDVILKFINNDKYVNIFFRCILNKGNYDSSSRVGDRCIIEWLPYFSVGIIDKISQELSVNEILFLLELIINKDINIKMTFDEINKQNYIEVIKQIIGNSKTEIKLFDLIYSYFDILPNFRWYNLYKIMVKCKDRKNVVEYFSKNIRAIMINVSELENAIFDRDYLSDFIKTIECSTTNPNFNVLLQCIDNDIPLLFLCKLGLHKDITIYNFIKDEIVLAGINISNTLSEYGKGLCHLNSIIHNLFDIYVKDISFARILINEVFKKDMNRFYVLSELLKCYSFLFKQVINKRFYSNLNLNKFLILLLDKDEKEIISYINIFTNLFKYVNDKIWELICRNNHFLNFKTNNNNVITISVEDRYNVRARNTKKFLR